MTITFVIFFQFDTQMCKMVFTVQGKTEEYVKLDIDGAGIQFLGEFGRSLCDLVHEKTA